MQEILGNNFELQVIVQLAAAVVLGGIVGLEREFQKKEAGLRTYSLVSLGAALFTIVGVEAFHQFSNLPGIRFDFSQLITAVALGIGFIGGGAIIQKQFHVEGLTTAAGLWVVAGIGVAVGAGLYWIAIAASLLSLLVFAGLRIVDNVLRGKKDNVS
ncbi:MAG: MgtC/SapB family protein [Candidatus Wildermuthbacteria bacterium]|nr:MgtC/SapB family protein [Candidatus Wildermuthbacteria bacterium]